MIPECFRCGCSVGVAGVLAFVCQGVEAGELVDEFSITLNEAVSDGVPGPGAGNIEKPGAMDRYTLTIDQPTEVYVDSNGGSCSLRWSAYTPDDEVIFESNFLCSDEGVFLLKQAGDYVIEAFGNNDTTGTYAFTIWQVPEPELFTLSLNEQVSEDVPAPGAGHIEQPASEDWYTMHIDEPVLVYFDNISGSCNLRWDADAPDGSPLFSNNFVCGSDPGVILLDQVGDYEIRVRGSTSATGTYSLKIWTVPPPDEFEIALDEVVSEDTPGPGAGNIEQPGSEDFYTLQIEKPVLVYFDNISGSCNLRWDAHAPDDTVLFSGNFICGSDPGEILLDQIGEYTLRVYGNQSATGTYAFELVTVQDIDTFPLALEQTVSEDKPGPGAGHIEEPGSVDEYLLNIAEPTLVYFDNLTGSCNLRWDCDAPDDSTVFSNVFMCADGNGLYLLDQVGQYTIRAYGSTSAVGTYSFIVWDVGEPDTFTINLDELVAEDLPGEGAGTIEKPGRIDLYYLTVDEPVTVCIEHVGGACNPRLTVTAPDQSVLLDDAGLCSGIGKLDLEQPGEYEFAVQANDDYTGTYSFMLHTGREGDLNESCNVNVSDLLLLLSDWGDCAGKDCPADLNDDGTVNVSDMLLLLAEWG